MSIETLIAELTSEINIDELDLKRRASAIEDKKAALRFLQARAQKQNPIPLSASTRRKLQEDSAPPERKLSLTEAVTNVVKGMPDLDIFVAPVYDAVINMNVDMPAEVREARIRIGTQLNRLEEKGVLKKVSKGGGNVPNRYRLITSAKDGFDLA